MKRWRLLIFPGIGLFLFFGAFSGADPMERLRELTGDLHQNERYLAEIRAGLNEAATAGLFILDDEQLNATQRSAIFVDTARLICRRQRELFAVTPYIREDAQSDFFTLRHRDLEDAIFESEELVKALKLYARMIRQPEIQEVALEGAGAVSANIRLFEMMRDGVEPLTNR